MKIYRSDYTHGRSYHSYV